MSHPRSQPPAATAAWRSLPDCAHLTQRLGCSRLALAQCAGEGCPFFQSPEEYDRSLRRCRERLCTLSEETQRHIAAKYYWGKRVWLEEGPQGKGGSPCSR